LTNEYAIEFDFGKKWAKSIGQSLYSALKTGKKPGVVLILEKDYDNRFFVNLEAIADKYNITVWTMTPEDLFTGNRLVSKETATITKIEKQPKKAL
jgi:hypothetical protein